MFTHHDTATEEGRLSANGPIGSENNKEITEVPDEDPFLVIWKDGDDPENPKNWTRRRKWAATLVSMLHYITYFTANRCRIKAVASFTFISPVSSSIVAPATEEISASLGITNSSIGEISYSIFVLGYAFGPLLLSPMSEIHGRSRVLQFANLFYLIFNTAAGFSRNTAELIAFRFLSGLGGSAPLAVGRLQRRCVKALLTRTGRWRSIRRSLAYRGTGRSLVHLLFGSTDRSCSWTNRRCLDRSMHDMEVDPLGSLDCRCFYSTCGTQIFTRNFRAHSTSTQSSETP